MPQKNAIDQRALKALVDFDIYANGDFKPESLGGLSGEDFEHARSAGLLFSGWLSLSPLSTCSSSSTATTAVIAL
jgi:hypothetical protein